MPSSFESPLFVPLAIGHVPLVVCWFNLRPEAVSFGVFGATEVFEILRSVVKADAIL